ncbi:NERD domain-containing protein [Frankia sp. CNm7]|uniref:NERD domain-containing protein n=1 Tax=Frankia nepalensis TaxID=1836974 RepID=A0A937RJ17_9ACTN|nr:nuclease-related domain-containing protein [Frankia nepalensis]MBL7498419.1 NERD domain-containing protein [Frankia nepalensis]MBL7509967.1 NERD domain-containing protein [Frankia nepalensis]MBL7520185.1 NERD domain-containing protein [Frankia nepalensis]MBL7629749.1 NERD domain-containing protein [Frankia nepalensis]
MGELQVTPWRRYGHDRLYVTLPDGQNVAWFDLRTFQLTILLDAHLRAALVALAPHLAGRPEFPAHPPPPDVGPPAPAPAAATTPAPPVGWTPEVPAPAAFRTTPPPPAPRPGPLPTQPPSASGGVSAPSHPADDLAGNPPGAAIRAKIDELTPGFWRALLNRLLRRPSEADPWRKGLVGEEMVGAELERLAVRGWRVLHSIPLPRGVDIDHLLIGPGGVFTFNTKYHVGARIWVGDQAVKLGGQTYPYVRKARAEASRAAAVLSRACGFAVRVEAVLAFVAPARLTVAPSRDDAHAVRVHAVRHDQIVTFGNLPGTWQPAHVEQIYAAARDRRQWLDA